MKRIIILVSLFTVLFAGVAFGTEIAINTGSPVHWTPPEYIQSGGVELEVIPENYLELYAGELSELVATISQANFGVSISTYDTMPLLGPDGEYRALAVVFTEGTEIPGTFDDCKNKYREMRSNQLEQGEIYREHGLHYESAEKENLQRASGELSRMISDNRVFLVGLFGQEIVFLDFYYMLAFTSDDYYPESETNPKSKAHEFVAFGILPEKTLISPDNGVCNRKNKYRIVSIWLVEGEIVWEWYIPEKDVKGHWLFYYPDEQVGFIYWRQDYETTTP